MKVITIFYIYYSSIYNYPYMESKCLSSTNYIKEIVTHTQDTFPLHHFLKRQCFNKEKNGIFFGKTCDPRVEQGDTQNKAGPYFNARI